MRLFTFLLKKTVEAFVIFLITVSIVFLLLYMVPGRVGTAADAHISSGAIEKIQENAGITGNLAADYGRFLVNTITFDFGKSVVSHNGMEINSYIGNKMLISSALAAISVILSVIIAIPIALALSRKPGKALDTTGMVIVSVFLAVPAYIFGLLLMLLGSKMGANIIFDTNDLSTWILPIISILFAPVASKVMLIRSEIIEMRGSQFAEFAQMKGLSQRKIEWRHIIKQSMFAIVTYFPVSFVGVLMSSVMIDGLYGIPGIGGLLSGAISTKDYPVIQALLTITILLSLVAFVLRDVTYSLLDPRIRVG